MGFVVYEHTHRFSITAWRAKYRLSTQVRASPEGPGRFQDESTFIIHHRIMPPSDGVSFRSLLIRTTLAWRRIEPSLPPSIRTWDS